MVVDSRDMPPVQVLPDAELARLVLAVPLVQRAVRLARWAGPGVAVDPAGELPEDELARAAAELGLAEEPDGPADTADAWAFAVDAGLVEIAEGKPDEPEAGSTAAPGGALEKLVGGSPRDVVGIWREGTEAALADAALGDLAEPPYADTDGGSDDAAGGGAGDDGPVLEEAAAFLDGALANLYLLTALEELDARMSGRTTSAAVPLPVLAASMVVPDEMEVPTDAVLEEVSDTMMRLDGHFRFVAPTGLLEYQPVDETLIAEDSAEDTAGAAGEQGELGELGEEEVSRYGMVRLTPLGVAAVRERLLEYGLSAPAVGDLADRDAATLLEALVTYPEPAAYAEAERWLAGRGAEDAARELLAAARGSGPGAPARRLACQQTLSRLGREAEPALREVLDDRELGGLARVWLVEHGAADVPAPDQDMVFWLTIDTLAAQLDVDDDPEMLQDLIADLVARHAGFFDEAWRVDHPATADVLEAMGRLHPDRGTAKLARKAAFKARSAAG